MEDYWKDKPRELKQLSYKIQEDDSEWAAKLIEAYPDEFAKTFAEYCALNYDLRNGLWESNENISNNFAALQVRFGESQSENNTLKSIIEDQTKKIKELTDENTRLYKRVTK